MVYPNICIIYTDEQFKMKILAFASILRHKANIICTKLKYTFEYTFLIEIEIVQ